MSELQAHPSGWLAPGGAMECRRACSAEEIILRWRRMVLSPADAALFYRAWSALLTWVNDQRGIVPRFVRPSAENPIDPEVVNAVKDVIWADDGLREQFLAEGAADLGQEERELVASWRHRVSGNFVLFKHLRRHSIFLGKETYGVVGIYSPLEEMFPSVPRFVEAVLLPFRDVIITDGLLRSPGIHLTFGGGARRMLNDEYSAARAASQVRTMLPWREEAAVVSPLRTAARKSSSRQRH